MVADGASGIRVVDIADPVNPVVVGNVDTGDARDVALDPNGDFALTSDGPC